MLLFSFIYFTAKIYCSAGFSSTNCYTNPSFYNKPHPIFLLRKSSEKVYKDHYIIASQSLLNLNSGVHETATNGSASGRGVNHQVNVRGNRRLTLSSDSHDRVEPQVGVRIFGAKMSRQDLI